MPLPIPILSYNNLRATGAAAIFFVTHRISTGIRCNHTYQIMSIHDIDGVMEPLDLIAYPHDTSDPAGNRS